MEEIVKILVVDDDEVDRMAVRRALKAAGVQIESSEANNCDEAIALLQRHHFDCVFLDYLLPGSDGLTLVQRVRALGITVPLVVLTGQGDEQTAVELMKAGASDYLSKNKVSPETLSRILRNAIRLHQAEMQAALSNQKLKESEERYRLVLEAANDGIWDWYFATDEVYCNDRLLEIIGVSRAEFNFNYTAFIELIHPQDLPTVQAAIAAHLTMGRKCEVEFRLRHASGEYRYCSARGKALQDAQNCPFRMSGIVSDITERKQLEEALRASESRFRRLAESNIIGIILLQIRGSILEANDAFLQMVGYSRQDLLAGRLRWRAMTPVEYSYLDERAIIEFKTTGVCTPYEKEYIRQNGDRIPVLLGGALVEGLEETAICFVLDLSERQRSEAEIIKLNRDLQHRVSELQTLLDVIPIGIAIAEDPECERVRLNPTYAKLLATADADASQSDQTAPDYKLYRNGRELAAEEFPMQLAAAQGIEVLDAEVDLVFETGKPLIKLLSYVAPLFDEQGKSRGSIGAFLNITERKRVEERERFLAEASSLLGTFLEYQTNLENLAHLAVPQIADWCAIHVVEEDGSLREVALVHTDPLKVAWVHLWQRRYPLDSNATYGMPQVARSGQSEFYPEVPDFLLMAAARNVEHLQHLRQLGFKSAICVPMKARGRTLGTITFITAESDRAYTQADLDFAEDLAGRAGLAVDNARLYQEATEIGENLRQAIIILGEQQQQLRVLQRITNLLNQRLTNLPSLLQVIVRAVCDGIGAATFCLIVLHNSDDRLEVTATAGIGRERLLLTEFFEPEEGWLGQVFLTGQSQLFQRQEGEGGETPPLYPLLPEPPASIYAVAIESAQAGRLGVLAIGNWDNRNAFDVEDRNLLVAVGEQAAIAINNARLIKALEEREERLALQNEVLARQNQELELNRQQIEQQNLKLLEAAQLKSQFIATMSHELRTPMNAILGFAQVLLRQRSSPLSFKQVDMVERILNNGKNLLALINDILDLSKIEAGRLSLKLEELNLTHLVLSTADELRSLAEEKHLKLQVNDYLDNPLIVNDSTRLRQILVNLISNAIKFTERGSVEIEIGELAANRIAIAVRDTGIGIAASDIKHIFEEFRQLDQALSKKYQGTGLGLAITQSLVHIMHGTITVESQLGQGSTFRIELPRRLEG